jgi:hypothetical protein
MFVPDLRKTVESDAYYISNLPEALDLATCNGYRGVQVSGPYQVSPYCIFCLHNSSLSHMEKSLHITFRKERPSISCSIRSNTCSGLFKMAYVFRSCRGASPLYLQRANDSRTDNRSPPICTGGPYHQRSHQVDILVAFAHPLRLPYGLIHQILKSCKLIYITTG